MQHRVLTLISVCGLVAACIASSGCKGGGASNEIAQVVVSYKAKPTMELPRGLKAVAVLDAETTDDAEAKWSKLAANMISGLLDDAARKDGVPLTIADRENLKKVMAEKDMAMAGLVEGAKAAEAGKLLGVQGMIMSSINVKVEKHTGKGRTINYANLYAWSRGGGGAADSEEIEKVTRNITVQCKFRLVDAANGKVLLDHVSPTLRKMDKTKTSPFFGASKTEAELTPRDQIIGELVEKEVRRFIGEFLPIQIEETIEVRASKDNACMAGVRFLAAAEYDEASNMFKQAIASSKEGDRFATFGLGVACEAKGQLDEALKYYTQAVRMDAEGAEQAMKRVKARMAVAGAK
jgi:hypothetical protein